MFENAPYRVREGGGSYNVCLKIDPVYNLQAVVELATVQGNALCKLLLYTYYN